METVEETFARATTRLHHLTIGDTVITTTAEHSFMVEGMGWIQAADLRPGDLPVTGGETRPIALDAVAVAVAVETLDGPDPVTGYNIYVHTHHTYFVLAGERPVLVHNASHSTPLGPHETVGGHAIERHVARPDAYLRSRNIALASTFNDRGGAERATAENLRANSRRIENWLSSTDMKLEIRCTMTPADGRVYVRAQSNLVSLQEVVTFLRRNPSMPDGYHIITSYPTLMEP